MQNFKRKMFEAALSVMSDERVKWIIGQTKSIAASGKLSPEELDELVKKIISDEIERWLILNELKEKGPLTVKELSEALNMPENKVVKHLIALLSLYRRVSIVGVKEDGWYIFSASLESSGG